MRECWINVYAYNELGNCYVDKEIAELVKAVGVQYRLHVRLK